MFIAPLAGAVTGKVHPGAVGSSGLLLMSAGCVLLSFVPENASHFDIVWRLMLCGAGFGFFQSPNNFLLLNSAPNHRAGSASGMISTARLTGQAAGAAIVAFMFNIYGDGAPEKAMLMASALTVCGAVLSLLRLGPAAGRRH